MIGYLLHRHGSPDVLRPQELPEPRPGPGQVAVRVEAIGLNYAEILSRKGLYGWAPKLPYVLGMECTGVIESLGDGVERSVGEPVVVGVQYGAYATSVVVDQRLALSAPEGLTVEERAAFPVNYATAWVGLMKMGRLRAGDRVLVSPAAGGVGTAAVQIAKKAGCRVVGAAGSDDKLERVRELGAAATVNYRAPGWEARLREAAGDGIDVALEMVGGEVFSAVKGVLAPFGQAVVVGYASLDYKRWDPFSWWRAWRGRPRMGLREMYTRSTGLSSSHLGYLLDDAERLREVWAELVEFTQEHGIRPQVGHVLPFEEAAQAHRLIESRQSWGKVVLRTGFSR